MNEDQANALLKRLDQIETSNTRFLESITRVERALSGDSAVGHRGIVQRIDAVETKVETHDRKLLVWGSLLTAVGIAANFAKDIFH